MAETISIDIRFAHLAGGGRVYAAKLLSGLLRQYPRQSWRVYYNPTCQHQQKIIQSVSSIGGGGISADINANSVNGTNGVNHDNHINKESGTLLNLQPVRAHCLTLAQHVEFLRYRDKGRLYHYLHFDAPLGMRHIPLVITIHDLYPLTVPGYCTSAKRSYFYHITRHNARRAARIIAISQYTKQQITEMLGIDAQKIAVVPQSHSPAYHPIEDDELLGRVREKYHLPAGFIFYTGNHKPHKNLPRLLKAYSLLPANLKERFPLILTGGKSQHSKQLQSLAKQLNISNYIQFTGWVLAEDLPTLYNLASMVVLPSLEEGFGLATLEAMACGKPVACSRGGAIEEVVGNVGRLFDPYNTEEMAEAIKLTLENDVENPKVREQCLARSREFSVENTAKMTYSVYGELA